jgi:uncharacterized Ntn-hydrolase superfamily protein
MTYSIVARDPVTGELGVAVQSHWFSVGPVVPWAMPGVGAVATQANIEVAFGPHGLALLQQGLDAPAALERLLRADPGAASRQVAIVDADGRAAAHTGADCMPEAGHVTGEGVSCQANIMASDRVWPAMLATFAATAGSLARRMLTALDAAEREGGDIRGRQSAAILVVPATGESWETTISLRVEDHPDPLVELRRLMALREAYGLAGQGDTLTAEGRHEEAGRLFLRASELAPDNHELLFWAGLGAADRGDLDLAVENVERAISMQPGWETLLSRLPAEVAPSAAPVLERLEQLGRLGRVGRVRRDAR